MSKLAEYLQRRSKAEFARQIGTSPSYLSQLLSGHRRPSYGMMQRIEAETGGAVDLKAWAEPPAKVAAE